MNCLVNKIKTKQGRKHNGSIQRPRIFYFSKKSPLRSLQSFPHRLFHSFLCFTKSSLQIQTYSFMSASTRVFYLSWHPGMLYSCHQQGFNTKLHCFTGANKYAAELIGVG